MDSFQPETVRQLVQYMYTGDYDDVPEIEHEASGHEAPEQEVPERKTGGGDGTSPLKSTASASLLEHVHVNSIADYYGVDRLVSLANTKIELLLESNGDDQSLVASLPSATEAAVRSTGDDGLVGILASASAANIATLLELEQFTSLSLLTDFSLKVLQSCARRNQALVEEQVDSNRQLRGARAQTQQRDFEITTLKECLKVLNRTEQCRNCAADFHCSIDASECILRCARCRCKHSG